MEEKKPMEIAEYNATEAGLNALKEKLKDVTYEIETTSGMALAKLNRRELITLRTNLETMRKELKKPALERAKFIDTKAKQLEAEIRSLEEPIHKQIKDEETKVALAKQAKENEAKEKLRLIMERIEKLRALPAVLEGRTSLKIAEAIVNIESVVIDAATFGDQIMLAQEAYDVTHQLLTDAFNETVVAEKEAAQVEEKRLADIEEKRLEQVAEDLRIEEGRKKLEKEQNEFKATQLIETLFGPLAMQSAGQLPSTDIDEKIRAFEEEVCTEDIFGDLTETANGRRLDFIKYLDVVLAQVQEKEKEAADKEVERLAAVEKKRVEDDAEKTRLADLAIENEKKQKKLEKEKKISDRAKLVAEAKCETTALAFQKIIDIINDEKVGDETKLDEIQVIAEANI